MAGKTSRLAWDRSPDSNIASYTPYYGTEKGRPSQSMPVGNVTTATIGNLNDATTYYFTVRAMNTMGLQSEPSNQVAHTTPDAASGKAFDRWLDDWVVQRLGLL